MNNVVVGLNDVPETQVENYLSNAAAHVPGIENEKVVEYYTNWADNYEKDLNQNIYKGPSIAANELNSLLENNKNASILDVACGTGFVGEFLYEKGFQNLYGLEPSEGMASAAKAKNLYKNIFVDKIYADKATCVNDTYDCVVISGGFGEGHIPCEGVNELARLTKSKGFVVIVMRKEYLTYVKDYVNRLEPAMDELVEKGVWKKIKSYEVENYSFNKTGIVYVFEKN